MWYLFQIAVVLILSFIVFIVLYLAIAFLLSRWPTNPTLPDKQQPYIIYAASNGVHTDLVFHINDLDRALVDQLGHMGKGPYVAIGWGDKGFYIYTPSWAELKLSTALNAAFLPSDTLMHVTYHQQIQPDWKRINIGAQQLSLLNQFVAESFDKNNNNELQLLEGAGFGPNDFFYNAVGHYTCFYTCNVWVNQALKKASVKTAIWSPFDKGILRHL